MDQQVHFHLAYIGDGKFQFTLTTFKKSVQWTEILTAEELRSVVRRMKPGVNQALIGKITISGDMIGTLRDYFETVLRSYHAARATGRDLDAEIRSLIKRPDPLDGTGEFLGE